jgi:hypothetical protein
MAMKKRLSPGPFFHEILERGVEEKILLHPSLQKRREYSTL